MKKDCATRNKKLLGTAISQVKDSSPISGRLLTSHQRPLLATAPCGGEFGGRWSGGAARATTEGPDRSIPWAVRGHREAYF